MKIRILIIQIALFATATLMAQVEFDSEALENHVTILASDAYEGRGFGSNEMARHYILNEYKKAGFLPVNGSYIDTFSIRYGSVRVQGKNIMGLIPGNDTALADEYILLGAHYDHLGYYYKDGDYVIYNGADDNASGIASIIEIGKVLMKNKDSLRRSILIVAFDGEECGLKGSKQFVKRNIVDISKIKLMFSLDMVGMYSANKGVILHGIQSLEGADEVLDHQKQDVTITKSDKKLVMRTDTYPFGEKGIPAIHVFTGIKSPYHKPEDDSKLLDYAGMAKICGLIYRITLEASGLEQLEAVPSLAPLVSEKKSQKFFTPGLRFGIGSNHHNYKDEFYNAKGLISFEAGVFGQYRFSEHLRIQPEILYEFKGSKAGPGNQRFHALTIPLNIMITSGDPRDFNPMAYFMFGGYYSYVFSGKSSGTDLKPGTDYNENEYGFTLGVGFQVNPIQFGIYLQSGLTTISADKNVKIYDWGKYFTVGYTF